jgi:hypothetical protein
MDFQVAGLSESCIKTIEKRKDGGLEEPHY